MSEPIFLEHSPDELAAGTTIRKVPERTAWRGISTKARNVVLRAATAETIYDVAKQLGLTETQALILRDISKDNPKFSDIAAMHHVSTATIHVWADIINVHGAGKKQPAMRLSEATEAAITLTFEKAKREGIALNLRELSQRFKVSLGAIKRRAKKHEIKGGGNSNRPTPKRDRVRQALDSAQGPIRETELASQLGVGQKLVNSVRYLNPEKDPGTTVKKRFRFAQRKTIVEALMAPHPSFCAIARQNGCKALAINKMAFDYGMPNLRTGRPTVDAALFLRVADLLVKRHLAAEGRDVPQSIAERYFGMVPRTHIREIADKYTDIPPDDMAISRITHLLGRLSDEQVLTLVPRLIDPDQVTEPLATAARHFLKLPAAMAKHVVARRLGTLPEPKLDPVALKFLQTVPETEIRGFVQRLLRMPNKPPHHLGWMDQFDGIRPWPQSMGFLNAALTHFLTSSGFTSVDDVHLKTDAKIVHLKLPSQIFLALQFSLAARGVIFDRHNLHNLENGSIAFAPNRTKLEKLASFALTA